MFRIIERLVRWENSNDEAVLAEARAEIMRSTDGNPPPVLDPFAGGGSIPRKTAAPCASIRLGSKRSKETCPHNQHFEMSRVLALCPSRLNLEAELRWLDNVMNHFVAADHNAVQPNTEGKDQG